MARPEFAHLHVHSEYSLLDGATRIRDMVRSCKEDGQRALALTDHGNLFGAIELYQACRAENIKPIIGCEVYVAMKSRLQPYNRSDNGYHHLTLLARDAEGYQNLLKLATIAYTEGFHYKPRIDKEILQENARGLTCLSGCLSGEINQLFLRGKHDLAERAAVEYGDIFGPEHFWLELQRSSIADQAKVNEHLVRLHKRSGIPIVATNDIHYLLHEHNKMQDVLLCLSTGAKQKDEKRFRFDCDSLYFRGREEMGELFHDLPQALAATMDVADQTGYEIDFGTYHVPVFDSDTGEPPDALFDRLCQEGLERIYGGDHTAARERMAHEAQVIREMGFVSYFLIVWDLIRWAREQDIPVGPGRGSAAGSIVAYVLGITKVDPLEYNLLFERFLNSARISMPDIDIDFCKEGRERILQYTRDRYGSENVAQIATFGTMASRTVIRDVGRVLDIPLSDVNRIAKKVPAGPGAPSLARALKEDSDLIAIREEYSELDDLFKYSVELEGMVRHVSTHAAGVVVADKPLVEYTPLCTAGDDVSTQWPAKHLEELGLLKMDYLGLRTLTIIARTIENIRKRGLTPPDIDALPAGDPTTYRMLVAGDTLGVFQLESEGMRKLLSRMKPDCFEDLIAALALYRPGPLESGMLDMFVRRKHGEEPIEYANPILKPLLEETYGCIVYQEQVMLISNHLGGFTLNEADNLRKAMGKKKPEIMQQFSEQFVQGAMKAGCSESGSREIWDNIVKFGGYGFNKSHSTAYAMITYQTAFLKANFLTSFLAANLSCEMGDSDKVKDFLDDARRSDTQILGPDIAESSWEFEPEDDAIRFGLGAIKGTGQKAVEAILATRDALIARNAKIGLHEMTAEFDSKEAPRTTWEALVKAGAFDSTGHDRGALLHALDAALAEGARASEDRRRGQGSLFGGPPEEDDGPESSGIDESHAFEKAELLRAEHEVLGFYFSGHPIEERAGLFGLMSTSRTTEIASRPGGTEVRIVGLIVSLSINTVKSGTYAGRKMARFRLEDLEGGVSVTCFPRTFDEFRDLLVDNTVAHFRCKVEERSDEPGLILEEVTTVDEALRTFEGGVVVSLSPADQELLPRLYETFKRFPGTRPLYFQVEGTDGSSRRVRASTELRVAIDAPLAEEVDRLLGRGRMRLARV